MPALSRLLITMGMVVLSLSTAPALAQTEISISSWVPPSHILAKDFLAGWAQEVEKATNGRVKFRFLPKMVASPIGHFDAVKDGLADLQGLKLRVGGRMAADVGQAIGATILQKLAPESYELLSQGIVDGVFFPGESPASFKLEKLLRYATEFPRDAEHER